MAIGGCVMESSPASPVGDIDAWHVVEKVLEAQVGIIGCRHVHRGLPLAITDTGVGPMLK